MHSSSSERVQKVTAPAAEGRCQLWFLTSGNKEKRRSEPKRGDLLSLLLFFLLVNSVLQDQDEIKAAGNFLRCC